MSNIGYFVKISFEIHDKSCYNLRAFMEEGPKKKTLHIAMVFFAKASAWITVPAIAIVAAHLLSKNSKAHIYIVLAAALVAMIVSFYGIYRESIELINHHDI